MPGSSELSDALNPYFYEQDQHTRSNVSPTYDQHARISGSLPQCQPISQPHRSELEDAFNPAAVTPNTPSSGFPRKSSRQSNDPVQLLKGLIQSISSYKATVEQEKNRRLAWEQKQEAKLSRQAELEKQVTELQNELDTLRAERESLKSSSQQPSSDSARESSISSTLSRASQVPGEAVLLFESRASETVPPEFVEGSSTSTPIPTHKRPRSGSPLNPLEQEPTKSRTYRSSRAQTIQAAMRNHILLCMDLDHDKELPSSHDESTAFHSKQPVRFIWDQTTKKSPHNQRMKTRILTDMMENKQMYPLVPPEEFTLTKLDGVFEQAYTTLRQKYASQQAPKAKTQDRAETKVRKARRVSRKKIKLANRVAARAELDQYKVPEFDFAFQLDCMSSEESSEGESDVANSSTGTVDKPSSKPLRIRFLAWRSTRLQELLRAIDEHEQHSRDLKPKRGVGRKDRRLGPPKDGNPPPPKGTPRWMVSKKWLRQATEINPQTEALVNPDKDNIASTLDILGGESEDELEAAPDHVLPEPDFTQMQVPDYSTVASIAPMLPMDPDAYQHAQYLYAQHTMWADSMAGYIDPSQFPSSLMQSYQPGVQHTS